MEVYVLLEELGEPSCFEYRVVGVYDTERRARVQAHLDLYEARMTNLIRATAQYGSINAKRAVQLECPEYVIKASRMNGRVLENTNLKNIGVLEKDSSGIADDPDYVEGKAALDEQLEVKMREAETAWSVKAQAARDAVSEKKEDVREYIRCWDRCPDRVVPDYIRKAAYMVAIKTRDEAVCEWVAAVLGYPA